MRFILFITATMGSACAVPSLHPMLSGVQNYCTEQMDCVDGNGDDVKACVVGIQNERRWARVYGCQSEYADYIDCLKEESECEGSDSWSFGGGDCSDESEDYLDCLDDESDAYEFGMY